VRRRLGHLLLASLIASLLGACGLAPSGERPTTDAGGTASAPTVSPGDPDAASLSPAPPSTVPGIATPDHEGEPPLAGLGPVGGSAVTGRLGSWCYGSACADVIPGPANLQPLLELPAAAQLELELPAPHRFVHWRVLYRDADDDDAPMEILAEGGARYPDPDEVAPTSQTPPSELAAVTLPAPPAGDWLLQVQLEFAGQLGNASYYWHATVP
jgi:hypothetical protein